MASMASAACTRPDGATDAAPAAPPAPDSGPPSILSGVFSFGCATDPAVACDGLFPVREASRVTVLATGEDAFRERTRLIEEARRSIRIQARIFRGDEAGLHFARILAAKKKAGL